MSDFGISDFEISFNVILLYYYGRWAAPIALLSSPFRRFHNLRSQTHDPKGKTATTVGKHPLFSTAHDIIFGAYN
jgi:hypothetical protein